MWTKVARAILKNRILILIIIGIITAFMVYKATQIQLSYEYVKVLPEKDTAFIDHIYFKSIFGEEANIMAIGVQDTAFFSLEKFKKWRKLGNDINKLDGITNVVSIYDVLNLEKDTANKKFNVDKVFNDSSYTAKELDSLVRVVKSLPFYQNAFYNDESDVYLMLVSLSKNKLDSVSRMKLINDINILADIYGEDNNLDMHYSGLPYIRTEITKKIRSELNLFMILAFAVCIIILFLFFRSFNAVFFSIVVVSVGVIWTFGVISLLNYKLTILTAMVPPLLIVIGIPNSIYLLNKYYAEYKIHGNKIKALQRIIYKIGNAVFLSNLTTACGFATFIFTSSDVLVEFGVVASMNIIGLFFLSLFLIPIIFSFLRPPKEKHVKHLDSKIFARITDMLVRITLNNRKVIYVVVICILIIGVYGISRMKSTGYMVDDIPHDDKVYVDLKFFEKHFNGVMPFEIMIDTKKPKGAFNHKTLKKIDEMQDYIASFSVFSKSLSLVDALKFARQAYYNGNPGQYKLPSKQEQNFILSYANVKEKDTLQTEGKKLLNTYVDKKKQITRLSFKVEDVGTVRMRLLTDSLKAKSLELFPEDLYDVTCTGISVVFFKGTEFLIKNLIWSMIFAIILISICMATLFKSPRMIIISIIPNLIPQICTAALMGIFNISIKPSTILIFSIAFGISVDSAIHFLTKYRQELKSNDWNMGISVSKSIKETGVSMLYTSIVLFFGFGIFVTSDFGGTMALGILVSLTLLMAVISNLVILPSLLLSLETSITRRAFSKEPLIQIFNEEEDIELDDLEIIDKNKS
ncbi:MAG: MMPL family transporter [Bacteroidota bacterium]